MIFDILNVYTHCVFVYFCIFYIFRRFGRSKCFITYVASRGVRTCSDCSNIGTCSRCSNMFRVIKQKNAMLGSSNMGSAEALAARRHYLEHVLSFENTWIMFLYSNTSAVNEFDGRWSI